MSEEERERVAVIGIGLHVTRSGRMRGWRRVADVSAALILGVALLPAAVVTGIYLVRTVGRPVVVRDLIGYGQDGPVLLHRFAWPGPEDERRSGGGQEKVLAAIDRYGLRELPALVDLARGDVTLFAS